MAVAVDDEQRTLAVEQQRRPLRGAQVRSGSRSAGAGVSRSASVMMHPVRELVRLDPRAAQLDQVLEGLGDEVGGGRPIGGAGVVAR